MKIDNHELAKRLSEAGLTPTELAKAAGVDSSTVTRLIYCGQGRFSTVAKICAALRCDIFVILKTAAPAT